MLITNYHMKIISSQSNGQGAVVIKIIQSKCQICQQCHWESLNIFDGRSQKGMVKVNHKRYHHYLFMWLYICLLTNMLSTKKEKKIRVYVVKIIKSVKLWRVFWHGVLKGCSIFLVKDQSYHTSYSVHESRQFSSLTTNIVHYISRKLIQFGEFCHPVSQKMSAEKIILQSFLLRTHSCHNLHCRLRYSMHFPMGRQYIPILWKTGPAQWLTYSSQ